MATSAIPSIGIGGSPLWYQDAVIYQLHVKSFFDSNGDGIGDFNGLSQKLDYLQGLGVTAIWLMPFCPSPLRDDGYDISNYKAIHPAYGTLKEFRFFLKQAHQRGLRVITELVLNHTSDQHPWFQRARHSKPGSPWRDWYVWSDSAQRFPDARVIFQDFESSNWSWDPVAGAYFWHRFYSHQPDLNFDNPNVRKAIHDIVDFWFGLGVDGLRLDAIPYLFEREGTNCENLPETHRFLKELRARADGKFQDRILLGEANQWPEDAAAYFSEGDECHMAFHFPLMPRLFMALHMEDSFPIRDILQQTPAIPDTCQWAIFLRNHDELTLEMVTDEERDYMYRVYAQDPRMRINLGIRRRLFPLLGNHRRRTELANALLFSLPGTPIIYYGDEIGMGDNVYLGDRDGVRTPMQWSTDRNAGFSQADPQKLFLPVIISPEYHCEVTNVEVQENNPHSVLWWMRRLISLRNKFKAFSRGTIEVLNPDNPRIFAFVRRFQDERMLVVANLSRFVQYAELDLSSYQGLVPVELFGKTAFPVVQSTPYFLSIGPHSFFWFYLTPGQAPVETVSKAPEPAVLPAIEVDLDWRHFFSGKADRPVLEEAFSAFITRSPWFGSRNRPLRRTSIHEVFALTRGSRQWYLVLLKAEYLSGDDELYAVPLTCADGPEAERLLTDHPFEAVATLKFKGGRTTGLLADATADPAFGDMVLQAFVQRRYVPGSRSHLRATTTPAFRKLQPKGGTYPPARLMPAEPHGTMLAFGDRLTLRFIRRLSLGTHPGLEVGRQLTERRVPPLCPRGRRAGAANRYQRTHDPRRFARVRDPSGDCMGLRAGPSAEVLRIGPVTERRRRPTRVASRFSGGDARAVYGAGGPRAHRRFSRAGGFAGAAHGGDACLPGLDHAPARIQAGALLETLPAQPVSIHAHAGRKVLSPVALAIQPPARGYARIGGRRAGAGTCDPGAFQDAPRQQDHRGADPLPWGLPSPARALHRQRFCHRRL